MDRITVIPNSNMVLPTCQEMLKKRCHMKVTERERLF